MKKNVNFFIFFISILFISGCGQNLQSDLVSENPNNSNIEENIKFVSIEEKFELPILLFHHVGKVPAGITKDSYVWYVSEDYFEKVLQYIENNNYQPITMVEMLDFVDQGKIPKKAIALVFDDGAIDFYNNAYPLLKEHNIKATVNVMTHVHSKDWINEEEILEMYKSGLIDFQSHGMYHPYLTKISKKEVENELKGSKEYLEKLLNKPTEVIAYPFGLYNYNIILIAREIGYRAGFTLHSGNKQEKNNLFELRRTIVKDGEKIEGLFHILP